ncbi:unnamed protein product, partial [Pylaiella littoralis]
FKFCWQCGRQPRDSAPATGVALPALPAIDHARLQARRSQILSAMARRAGQVRKGKIAKDFHAFALAFSHGRRGWDAATPDDVFNWLCFLDSQGNGTKVVHDRSCPGVGSPATADCSVASPCPKRYAAESLTKGFWSKLKTAYREQLARGDFWNPETRAGNPCDAPLVEPYLLCAAEEQKMGGVADKQAEPTLAHALETLLASMRTRAQLSLSIQGCISITRDIALFALVFYTMRRGFDLSFTLALQVLKLPNSEGFIFNFHFGKTLRTSTDSVVVWADADNHQTCAVRAVNAYITAATRTGWDLALGHLFPVVEENGRRGSASLTAPRMTASLQSYLRDANLPANFTMHSFRVGGSLSESLAGTAVDEIMKLGG